MTGRGRPTPSSPPPTSPKPSRSIYTSNSGPMKTLYGTTWSTSTSSSLQGSSTSTADSAYTSLPLPLHTDMTYFHSPPGLQIFTMSSPAPNGGGASVYRDGFEAARALFELDRGAFEILTEAEFTYRYIDEDQGWHLEASGPIISVDKTRLHEDGTPVVKSIRHNDLDRVGFLPPLTASVPSAWYDTVDLALRKWDEVVHERGRVKEHLRAGEAVIVHNNRVMHARESFELGEGEERSIVGCYVSREDIESRWRRVMTKRLE